MTTPFTDKDLISKGIQSYVDELQISINELRCKILRHNHEENYEISRKLLMYGVSEYHQSTIKEYQNLYENFNKDAVATHRPRGDRMTFEVYDPIYETGLRCICDEMLQYLEQLEEKPTTQYGLAIMMYRRFYVDIRNNHVYHVVEYYKPLIEQFNKLYKKIEAKIDVINATKPQPMGQDLIKTIYEERTK